MADTITLMKQRVLNMAIRGELVDQRPEEGTAEELIKSFSETVNSNEETLDKPFRIPENWKWSMLSDITEIIMGQSPPGKSVSTEKEGIEFHQGKIYFGDMYLLKSEQKTDEAKKIVDEDTVLLSVRAPVGNLNITRRRISIGRGLCGIKGKGDIDSKFLFYFLSTTKNEMEEKSTGTTFKAIAGNVIKNLLVPLPPLQEQQRIVAKIEEIFAVIDQIGTKKEEALAIIKNMRQTALQDAIMGVLVNQEETDEPASVLYEKIQAEKEKLVKEKKIKKNKPLPEIETDKVPFEIPDKWKWVRLSDIGSIIGGGTPKTSVDAYWEGGTIPWVSPADLTGYKERTISEGRKNITELGLSKSSARLMPAGTVLFSSRAPIGYVAIAENPISTNQGFKSVVPYVMDMNHYIYYYFFAFIDDIKSRSSGTTFKEISGSELGKSFFPMPPLAEQQRIVEKLDEIMAICDQMEAIFDGSSEIKKF